MIDYRPFRNTDPPALCELWRSQTPLRALFQPLSPSIFESTVLSKPFFDRQGLIVATQRDQPIGFAHAGFGTREDGSGWDMSVGATCMLMVAPSVSRMEVSRELLTRSEQYLMRRGARHLFGGGSPTIAPFYLGLYGGANVPGLLATDRAAIELFAAAGYAETRRGAIMQRPLTGFRPVVDRQQVQFKRSLLVELLEDPPCATWWEACTTGLTERCGFTATERTDPTHVARTVFWNMEPLASGWGVPSRGLVRLEVPKSPAREALSLFLLGESLRQLAAQGATLAEAHVASRDDPLHLLLAKLGFEEIEQSLEMCKDAH